MERLQDPIDRALLLLQVEQEIGDGKYEEAISVLRNLPERNPEDREAWLYQLLAKVKLHGIGDYGKEIDQIREFGDLEEKERWIVRQILFVVYEDAQRRGDQESALLCQSAVRRLLLGLPLNESTPDGDMNTAAVQVVHADVSLDSSAAPHPKGTYSLATNGALAYLFQPRFTDVLYAVAILLLSTIVVYDFTSRLGEKELGSKEDPPLADLMAEVKSEDPFSNPGAPENLVLGVTELGFQVLGMRDSQPAKEALRQTIENQLSTLRQIYNEEVERNPELMGLMLLQLNVKANGAVRRVQELTSRIQDKNFKRMVLQEAAKWKFSEKTSAPFKVNFPLLFVPAGMDVSTLIRWEQTIGGLRKQAGPNGQALSRADKTQHSGFAQRTPNGDSRGGPVAAGAESQGVKSNVKTQNRVLRTYRVRTGTVVRAEPRFASPLIEQLGVGAEVRVIGFKGDWLEVLSTESNSGFIRREFATPVDSKQSSSPSSK